MTMKSTGKSLIGLYFTATTKEGMAYHHGVVWGMPAPGFYLVQFLKTANGHKKNVDVQVVKIDDMTGWFFFENPASRKSFCDEYNSGHDDTWSNPGRAER